MNRTSKDWVLNECPKTLIEAACAHSLLNTLGFSLKDHVFIAFYPTDVFVLLKFNGMEAPIRIGKSEHPTDEMVASWKRLSAEWNQGGSLTNAEKNLLYRNSTSRRATMEIIDGLLRLGIPVDPQKIGRAIALQIMW